MTLPSAPLPRRRLRAALLGAVAAIALGAVVVETGAFAPITAVADTQQTSAGPASFADVVDRVKSSVVSVKVKMADAGDAESDMQGMPHFPPGSPFERFFRDFGVPDDQDQGEAPAPRRQHHMTMAQGSGFFISPDGHIVTNYHVVQNSKTVTITMDNGKVLDAKVIGTDPKTDLALLKVDQPGDYPYVTFAKETPKIGDWVVAIGNPYGLGGTVTAGIVSAEGRDIGDGPYDRFLQIDAPINKGNSGGPAFDEEGQVVGVNTAIYSPSGGSVGIGFAIPATTVSRVVDALEHGGVVARGYLGVEIQPVGPDIAEALGMNKAQGALIDKTMQGTPAAEAGLKPGDVITQVNGQEVGNAGDLTREIGGMKPGEKIQLTYLRNGAEKTAEVTLAPQTNENVASAGSSATRQPSGFGLELAPASEAGGPNQKGVAIVGVDPSGQAAAQGLTSGDVILDVSGKPVSTPGEVKTEINAAREAGRKAVLMRIQTAQGSDRFVALAFPKA